MRRLQFKPPKGVGFVAQRRSGHRRRLTSTIDPDRGEYAGALQLEIADFLTVSAIGLISTRMPDGSRGFSLLIIITADFGTGIQLGFGFTLLAVGGLLGLNRTMLLSAADGRREVRRDRERDVPAATSSPTRRASSATCARFSRRRTGTFLIGPMAKIGWGEPTLISLSLGVIIEIPPGDIAILGILRMALPADDAADPRAAGQLRRRVRVRQAALLLLRLAVRFAHAVHHAHGRDGRAVRLRRRRQLRAVGRRLSPAIQSAAAAVPLAAAHRDRSHQRVVRADPLRRLLRRHDEHRPVRRALRASSSGSRRVRSRALRASTR